MVRPTFTTPCSTCTNVHLCRFVDKASSIAIDIQDIFSTAPDCLFLSVPAVCCEYYTPTKEEVNSNHDGDLDGDHYGYPYNCQFNKGQNYYCEWIKGSDSGSSTQHKGLYRA